MLQSIKSEKCDYELRLLGMDKLKCLTYYFIFMEFFVTLGD